MKFHRDRILALFGIILLVGSNFMGATVAQNAKPVYLSPAYNYYISAFGTHLFWNESIYADSLSYFPDHIEFANASLGAASNASQSFGIAVEYANATLESISKSSVKLSLSASFPGQDLAYLYFYLNNLSAAQFSVFIGNSAITSRNYYTSLASFDSSPGPAVFVNATGNYVEIKTSTFEMVTISHTIATLSTGTRTSGSQAYLSQILTAVTIVILIALVLGLYARRRKKQSQSKVS